MRESIHDLLRNFRGLEPLKRMFWQELNYDRVNQAVSTRAWGDAERQMINGEPLLLAEHGEFKVLYLHMRAGLVRDDQRVLINRLLQAFPYALFVFSDSAQQHWHFINVKYERDPKRRRVFRRITVLAGSDQLRTATERLAMLDLETVSRDLFGIPPLAIQQRHDQAFDVEAVTREFFREYDKIFRRAESHMVVLPEERRRLFIQKLFNRLMFIVFLEHKGWLRFKGRTDYLLALWQDYTRTREQTDQDNFYWNRLYHLFFSGLNNSQQANLMAINRGSYLHDLIGDVPYLNGGLFESDDDDDDNRNIVLPDALFESAINDLFYRFNFTVAESTPLDIEVAVDPEMLGKIFEELVTGRHESGSYYTPKPVVSFMCREGLKGYLRAQLPNENTLVIARFVDDYDATEVRDPEAILLALQRVTVCDPACGSGAYLLGMMQELLLLRGALFTARHVDARSMYDRKLEIIQNNIYGVDKDPFATNIAQLRLWLSLIVDFERGREGAEPPMLPNLDYKIEQGDSLLAPDPSGGLQLDMFRQQQVTDYSTAKKGYLGAHGEEKLRLRREVERLRAEIRQWARGAEEAVVFDWAVDFVEVFDDGGFDIVLANPPYVRQELISDKPTLRRVYSTFYSGTADLYTYFYARAVQMLKSGGMLVFISSNKWLRADYGTHLRALLASNTRLETVIDFGDLPVFGAIAYPVIIVAQREPPTGADVRVLTPQNLDRLDDLREHVNEEAIDVAPASLRSGGWSFGDAATYQRMETMRAAGVPLGEYVKRQIYYGIKTGLNEAFVINGATRAALIAEDAKSAEVIKPLATGKDIRKWTITDKDKWLIVTPIGIDIKRQPAIFDYLQQWQSDLEKRGDKGKYWWELRACDYYDAFEKPKIMFPDIAKDLRFSLDRDKVYGNNTMYFIPIDDLYLLGLLNSSVVELFYKQLSTQIQGGYIRMFRQYVEQIPIPVAPVADSIAIADLAQKCLDKRGIGCEVEEAEINERAARLYGLKPHEVQQ